MSKQQKTSGFESDIEIKSYVHLHKHSSRKYISEETSWINKKGFNVFNSRRHSIAPTDVIGANSMASDVFSGMN